MKVTNRLLCGCLVLLAACAPQAEPFWLGAFDLEGRPTGIMDAFVSNQK